MWDYAQPSAVGWLRDYTFLIYQTNGILTMGAIGGPAVLYLLYRTLWRNWRERGKPQRVFWPMLVGFSLVVGIAVHPGKDYFGVAHVTLQPLVVLGLSLLAGSLVSMPRVAAWAIVAGLAIDFSLGIFLQAQVQNLENGPDQTVFAGLVLRDGRATVGAPQKDLRIPGEGEQGSGVKPNSIPG